MRGRGAPGSFTCLATSILVILGNPTVFQKSRAALHLPFKAQFGGLSEGRIATLPM